MDTAEKLVKDASKAEISDPGIAERIRQILDLSGASAGDIEKADKTLFVDMSKLPPVVSISGFWKGQDIARAQAALRRAYRINRSVLKAKGVGKTDEIEPPKRPVKGKAAIDAKVRIEDEARRAAIQATEAEESTRILSAYQGAPEPALSEVPQL